MSYLCMSSANSIVQKYPDQDYQDNFSLHMHFFAQALLVVEQFTVTVVLYFCVGENYLSNACLIYPFSYS